MDKFDLRARGVANNSRKMHSPGKKCTSGKVKNLSNCCGLEKQGHESDNEISSCEGTKSVAMETKFPNCEHISSSGCTKDIARDCGSLSSVMKDGEVLKQSSINSDVSSETRQLRTENSELITGTDTHSPSVGEDGKQLKTESSSSNSSCIVLPASSNDSIQEAPMDGKTCKFSKYSDSVTSTSADKKCSPIPIECRVKSSVCCGASEIVQSSGATDSDKVPGVIVEKTDLLMSNLCKMKITELPDQCNANSCYEVEEDDALEVACRVAKEVEQDDYKEASARSFSVEEKNSVTVDQTSVDPVYPTRRDSLTESCRDKLCEVQVIYCHTKDEEDRKMSMKDKQLYVGVDESAQDMGAKVKHTSNLTTKPEDISCNGQTTDVSSIDLNEDFLGNETDYVARSVKGIESHHTQYVSKPVPVVAEPGITVCSPLCRTKGKPGGWRGSAATSAFRKTHFFKKCNGIKADTDGSRPSHIKGLDLNIAAAGADLDEFLPDKCIETPSGLNFGESSMDVCSTIVERFDFDLNCASESNGTAHLSSPPASPSRSYTRDFDLNDNPACRDPCYDAHQSGGQGMQPLRNKASDDPALLFVGNSRQLDPTRAYLPDLSSLHSYSYSYSHGHAKPYPVMLPPAEQMQRMVSRHHNTPPPPLPPHAFHYNHGLLFEPSNHHNMSSPSMYSPYMTDPQGASFTAQIMTLPAFPIGRGDIRPNFDLNVENTSRGVISRYITEEQMRCFQFKRREPEGGWDGLSHRQVNPWR